MKKHHIADLGNKVISGLKMTETTVSDPKNTVSEDNRPENYHAGGVCGDIREINPQSKV